MKRHISKIENKLLLRYLLPFLIVCTFEHQTGKEIRRIVSLAPSLTEIIFFLGTGDRLVGVSTYCDYPESARRIEKIGDFSNPSLERIIALKPDLVLAAMPEQKRIVTELEKLKIPVFSSHPKSLTEIVHEIDSVARLLQVKSPKDSLLRLIRDEPAGRRVRVYLELSPNPVITTGISSYLNDLIKKSGGVNIFGDLDIEFPTVSWVQVLRRDPEVILIFHDQDYQGRVGWDRLTAVKNDLVIKPSNPDIFLRPGPRVFQALQELKEIIKRCVG
jgi:iron complex transport system substrate-binding protein